MIIYNQQIAVHLGTLRNLTPFTSGKFSLRLSLTELYGKYKTKAIPVSIIQNQQSQSQNRSQFDQEHFLTRVFPLKSSVNVDINEVYVFKLDSPVTSNKDEELLLALTVQLIQIDGNKHKVVGVYKSSINSHALHQYIEIDFYQNTPCQIVGSFHRCFYKFSFKATDMEMDLRNFSEKYYKNRVDELLQYLQNEGFRSYKLLAQSSSYILKQQIEIDCVELQQPIIFKVSQQQIDVWQRETEIGSDEIPDAKAIAKKRRQRIFSITTKDSRAEKYQTFEKNLHENAQKIYQLWRQLLQKLLSSETVAYLSQKAELHHRRLVEKTKESVSSFRGSWDIDMYGEEVALRSQLAHQLRSQNNQLYKDANQLNQSQFPILNQSFFSTKRPVVFEEKAFKTTYIEEQLIPQVLVILVHGLGACRLDMQKWKTELKRYYGGKLRVFASSTNEGRTEGDIESMGMRLASEIDYELSKYNQIPKVCIIGHSMGGLIIRSALPRLQKYKKHFHSLITLSSPHLGYAYSASKLIDAGLWFMNTVKKCTSLIQMTMNDHQKPEQTFLYRLSQKPGLQWFKKVIFLGSHQDLYVPYYSARMQKHEQSLSDEREKVTKGKVHCQMVDNIISRIKGCIMRLDINFCTPQQNLDNLIGRAAHISFINNIEMVRTLVLGGKHYFF